MMTCWALEIDIQAVEAEAEDNQDLRKCYRKDFLLITVQIFACRHLIIDENSPRRFPMGRKLFPSV